MLGAVKTKKPRALLGRFLPFVAVAVLVGILFVYWDTLSKNVLKSSVSTDVRQTTSTLQNAGVHVEEPFEARVKTYNVDSTAAVEALLLQDAKEQAEEERSAHFMSADVDSNDETHEEYAYEDYTNDPGEKAGDKQESVDKGKEDKWEKNPKTLVEPDYDDPDAGGDDYDPGETMSSSSQTATKAATKLADRDADDYDYDYENELEAAGKGASLSKTKKDLVDKRDGEAFLDEMEACDDLICIQEAHAKYSRAEDMFNFPHFMIIGFQKAATTSLKRYLERHGQIDKPRVKEPNFFPYDCEEMPPERCSEENTTRYIQSTLHKPSYIEKRGKLACMEASTHIVRAGHNLAPRMAKLMPWLKIIVQFREPISRAASMLIHNKDTNQIGCLMRSPMGHCLLHHSQLTEMQKGKYEPLTYTEAVLPWIENFPKEQIHVIQYETLINPEKEASELQRVKKFLGVDESQPEGGLEVSNARRFRINPEGWQVQKSEYEELIRLVESDTLSLVDLLYEHDLLEDKQGWVDQWRAHWNSNLATCGSDDVCMMSLS